MTTDEHQHIAMAIEAITRRDADDALKQQLTESWVDEITDVDRLRSLVKDKARRLQAMVDRLDQIKWHFEERELALREEMSRLRLRSDAMLERQAKLANGIMYRRIESLASVLGVAVPNKRKWRTLLRMVKKLVPGEKE